ncbi:MAG: ATPase domain-containing protein [Candidatus Thorarchaeota archaeon]
MVIKKNEETDIENFYEKNNKKYNIPKVALKALKDFGIFDARVLSVLTEAEIANIPNISEKTAVALVRAADDNFRGPLFQKAADQSERFLKKRKYFDTGSKNLNELLGGGMPTSAIIEINGEYRTGKTQTCLTCSVTAQLPEEKGGLGRPVIYVDTENSFQATHLIEIGKRFGIDSEELLENIFVVQAEQLRYLNQAIDRLPGYVQALDPGLIIIDSLMAPFRNEFHELNLLAVRQKKLGKLIGLLKRIAIAFNTSVIFTNQVMANIGPSGPYIPVIATGGHVVAHASDIRIFMKKLSGNQRRAKIDDCAWLPNETTDFFITPVGIADTESTTEEKEKEKTKTKKKSSDEEIEDIIDSEEIEELPEIDEEMIDEEEEVIESPLLDGINEVTSQQRKTSKVESVEETNEENELEVSTADLQAIEEEMRIIDEEPKTKSTSKTKSKSGTTSAKKSKVPA